MTFINWLAVVVWARMIYYFSAIPGLNTGLGVWDYIVRKTAHVIEFGVLASLLYVAWASVTKMKAGKIIILVGVLALLYAVSDEFHQTFVANRHGCPADVMIDLIGIAVVVLFTIYAPKSQL